MFTINRFLAGMVLIVNTSLVINLDMGWIPGILTSLMAWFIYDKILDHDC
jgi:hypothetical protein